MVNHVVKDNVRVWSGIDGAVFWAPKGTPLPETPFEDLDPAFNAIGALNEDGPTEGMSVDSNKIKGWPAGQTLRVVTTATEKTFSFTALEEKPVVTRLFYGHGDITVQGVGDEKFARYDIPESIGTVEGTMVTVFADGDYMKIRCMELVQVSERGDVSNGTEDAAGYELTVENIGKDYVLTTQPSFLEDETPSPAKTNWLVTVGGEPTGGTFTLSADEVTTEPIAFDAAASAVESALNTALGASAATVTGSGPYTVVLATAAVLTADGSALTGGDNPAVTVA